jgi:hypothetical protein
MKVIKNEYRNDDVKYSTNGPLPYQTLMRKSAEQQQNNEVESFLFDNTIGLRPPLLLVVRSIPKKINCSEIVQRRKPEIGRKRCWKEVFTVDLYNGQTIIITNHCFVSD